MVAATVPSQQFLKKGWTLFQFVQQKGGQPRGFGECAQAFWDGLVYRKVVLQAMLIV